MKRAVAFLAILGVVVAVPTREKRQIGCISAFQNVPNVCAQNPTGQAFFPHPTDPSKFLQCDVFHRMHIIQCPMNELFDIITSGCRLLQTTTQTARPFTRTTVTHPRITFPPLTFLPYTYRPVTQAPITTAPGTVSPSTPAVTGSPCSLQGVALGQLYFAFPGDSSKFYECDLQGNSNVMTCPNSLVWDQTILSCVYPVSASSQTGGRVKPTPQIPAGQSTNPCTAQALSFRRLFFPHPENTKYIQCDLTGNAFVNSCPSKLVWNSYLETCYKQYSGTGRK